MTDYQKTIKELDEFIKYLNEFNEFMKEVNKRLEADLVLRRAERIVQNV